MTVSGKALQQCRAFSHCASLGKCGCSVGSPPEKKMFTSRRGLNGLNDIAGEVWP